MKETFERVGGMGPYQLLICVVAISSMLSCSLTAFNVVFQVGVADHWCHVPDLHQLNVTEEQIKNASLPYTLNDGFSQCHMYDYNYSVWTEETVLYYTENDHSPNASTVSCQHGWDYDLSIYGPTAASQVR